MQKFNIHSLIFDIRSDEQSNVYIHFNIFLNYSANVTVKLETKGTLHKIGTERIHKPVTLLGKEEELPKHLHETIAKEWVYLCDNHEGFEKTFTGCLFEAIEQVLDQQPLDYNKRGKGQMAVLKDSPTNPHTFELNFKGVNND